MLSGFKKSFFEKKISSKYFFSEPEKLAALRFWLILGEIPCVESSQFKWKIEGPLTFRALKKYISMRFFFQKIFFKSGLLIASICATLDPQRTSPEMMAQL